MQRRLDVSTGDLMSLAHLVCDRALNLPFARAVSSHNGPKAAMSDDDAVGRTVKLKVLACGNGVIKDRPLALLARNKRRSGPVPHVEVGCVTCASVYACTCHVQDHAGRVTPGGRLFHMRIHVHIFACACMQKNMCMYPLIMEAAWHPGGRLCSCRSCSCPTAGGTCTHVFVHARVHACAHACARAYVVDYPLCACACMHVCMHTRARFPTTGRTRTSPKAHMHTCTHAHMHTRTHAHMHTRTRTLPA